MVSELWLGVSLLLSLWSLTKCADLPNGVLDMECRDRFLIIAADLSFTGDEPLFQAVDDAGVYTITKLYAAECGYSTSLLTLPGHVVLRASYFSCHADNQDDKVFTFSFNLIVTHGDGNVVTYPLNKTCSPSIPWSPREITCEVNYMEVSVRSDMTCPSGTKKEEWNAALKTAYPSADSDWQVMFQMPGHHPSPMTFSEARRQNYVFHVTDGRLVFRTPYRQPESITTMMDGVPVEVIHSTLFIRQSWIVLMVDLVAACSMHEGSYDGIHLLWETPEVMSPLVSGASGLYSRQVKMGVSGELLEQPITEERGYIMEEHGTTVQIAIPYNAEGGYKKSFVMDNMYHELYIFHLYFEQIFMDEDYVDTRLRFFRPLATPVMALPQFVVNRTILEEKTFTIYLGHFREDVELAAIQLNGLDFTMPFINASCLTISIVDQPNDDHGYTLYVPFDCPVVRTEVSKDGFLQYSLGINFTLAILPQNEYFYHRCSIVALITALPPAFEANCSDQRIRFKLDHRPFDYLWQVYIGSDPLTPELAARQGYTMHNDSQSLILDVPVFTNGYTYKDMGLNTFFGTFTLHIYNRKTMAVQSSSVKTCEFQTTEFIVCTTDGKVNVVADVSMVIPTGESPASTSLLNQRCGPKEADDSRVRFSFALNSCGTKTTLIGGNVIYENEIIFKRQSSPVQKPFFPMNATEKVTLKCSYPLAALHRLFMFYRFESTVPGLGSITRSTHDSQGVQHLTLLPPNEATSSQTTGVQQLTLLPPNEATSSQTTGVQQLTLLPPNEATSSTTTMSTTTRPINLPAFQTPQYIKMFSFIKDFTKT